LLAGSDTRLHFSCDIAPRGGSARQMRLAPLAILFLLVTSPSPASADTVIVGTKESPPFSMKGEDGQWTGISIELWKRIAADLHVNYEIREYDLKGLLAAVQAHQVDVAVASTTITAERETLMDFSHPIYSTGLSIAVLPGSSGGALALVKSLFTWDLAKVLLGLFALLFGIGALIWLLERRHNAAQFGGGAIRGIGAGVWWSAVTMTTVGYGDKSPVTVLGRLLGLVWMFAAIILISIFTASITSNLTVDRLESSIKGPEDLPRVRVATVAGSTSAAYLDKHHIAYTPVPSVLDGLRAVAAGQIDAMVYDQPILEYLARRELPGQLVVLAKPFERQDYGFAMPLENTLRTPLNRALLAELQKDAWTELLQKYLGHD
jgi:ABC-type amino acid transport substrate-binding protein